MTKLVYFFVITMTVVRCSACPIMCSCHNFSKQSNDSLTFYLSSECGHRDVTAKHQNTQHCLEVSYLNETDVRNVVECLSSTQTNPPCQTEFRLIHSVLPDNISFTNAPCIEQLNLTENNIRYLNQISIRLANLNKLDLSRNSIEEIDDQSFSTLRNLQSLNLSSNSISEIYAESFQDLVNLTILDLSYNHLSSLNESVFTQLVNLQKLNLSHNNLKMLNEQLFSNLLEMQQLDLSFNKLIIVSSAINLPSLAVLKLNENTNLSEEPHLFFLTGGCLQEVDATHVGLKQIPTSLTLTVRILHLKNNLITTLRRGDFDSYPLLQTLDVSANNLSNIEYDALGRLNYLNNLYLKNNFLVEVPKSLPENLTILNVEDNIIQTLNGRDFEGLNNLEVLLLSGNNITTIAADVGDKLKRLKTLDVSRNKIMKIEMGCFEGAKMLRYLRLSRTEIKSSCDTPMSSIFYGSNIVSLDLSGSPQLAQSFLTDNSSLNEFKELKEVDVRDSKLAKIPQNVFIYLHKLQKLRIEGNKLSCNNLRSLSSWMKQHGMKMTLRMSHCIPTPNYSGIAILDYAAGLRYMKALADARNSSGRPKMKKQTTRRVSNPRNRPSSKQTFAEIQTTKKAEITVTISSLSPSLDVNFDSTTSKLEMSSRNSVEVDENFAVEFSSTGASTKVADSLPYMDEKRSSLFMSASAILFQILTISIIVLTLVIIVKCSKRRRYNVRENQQENELLNSGLIELW